MSISPFLCHKLLGKERSKDSSDPECSEDFAQQVACGSVQFGKGVNIV